VFHFLKPVLANTYPLFFFFSAAGENFANFGRPKSKISSFFRKGQKGAKRWKFKKREKRGRKSQKGGKSPIKVVKVSPWS